MKTLILKAFNLTFMIDGITTENQEKDTNVALKMIFDYLTTPVIAKHTQNSINDFSAFVVEAKNKASVIANATIDTKKITGNILGDSVTFEIDSLVVLDIRDFKIVDFKRLTPHQYLEDSGSTTVSMIESRDGEYVSFDDYQELLKEIVLLKTQA